MLGKIQGIIDPHDGLVVELTSATIVEFQDPKADSLLDYRTYAHAVQEGYNDAEKDAQNMIMKEPTVSLGYLRLGSLYQMQGKQQSAIDVYETGLRKVPADDRGYTLMLVDKDVAIKQSEKRVDFITGLPIEVVDETIVFLPLATKLSCLGVSKTWKTKVLACEKSWRCLEVTDDVVHGVFTPVISSIAGHVENMVIRTTQRQILEATISRIHTGRFNKVKSLHCSLAIMRHINANMMEWIANAFRQINTTLTSLVLSYSVEHTSITLADLLASLPNLRSLAYSTSAKPFTSIVGAFPLPEPHHTLVDLNVNASSITGEDIIPLLRDCPKVEHMALSRCNNSVLDIVDANCPNLKTLVYNRGPNYKLPSHDQRAVQLSSGLQAFSVWQHHTLDPVIDLLRRNTDTLRILDLHMTKLSCEYLSVAPYQNMEFRRLEKIIFQGRIDDDIPQLILQWISNCTTLVDISASELYSVTDLVQVLVNRPRLASLSLERLTTKGVPMDLTRLFSSYAANSRKNEPAFQNISLQRCEVNRDVFCALSSINTLTSITLSTLDPPSPLDLDYLFSSLGESTTEIHLDHMNSVTDQHLAMLGNLKGLRSIHLEFLRNLTDKGVIEMTNNAPVLRSLTIQYCGRDVTDRSIVHAKRKIKHVVYKPLFSSGTYSQ